MDFQESEANKECEVALVLPSTTPVVGCQISPHICHKLQGTPTVRSLSFCWLLLSPFSHPYAFLLDKERIERGTGNIFGYREMVCCVHIDKLATVQCMPCVKPEIPVSETFYCSPMCFLTAWQKNMKCQHYAAKTIIQDTTCGQQAVRELRSCGSWPELSSDQLLGENEEVVERQGKVWIKVGSSKTYEPSMDDLGFSLRLECSIVDHVKGTQLASVNFIVTDPVTFPPRSPRSMIKFGSYQKSGNINFKTHSSDGFTFSVLSYNILADMYAGGGRYYYCPKRALLWEYRRQNLLQEIIEYNADILCLQEVQSDHFESFFKHELIRRGYSVIYKKKKTELYTSSGHVSEGCATFYRHSLFKEIRTYELEFDQRAKLAAADLKLELKHEDARRLVKDNVALIVILETIKNGRTNDNFQSRVCVANTHIHASTKLPDVKLYQVANLVYGLEKIAESKIPILICGDLNSTPESDPHMLLVRGRIGSVSGEEIDPLSIYKILKPKHPLGLVSAYASFFHLKGIEEKQLNRMDPGNHEPLFTCFTRRFVGTLDYILYTADSLRVEGLLELLDLESLGVGLPSPLWSSDHIALMASFRLDPPSTSETSPPLPHEI
ncbi:hypothetical protein PTKIN_Ptkin09bG0193800 [Pterospermum kingtungense]